MIVLHKHCMFWMTGIQSEKKKNKRYLTIPNPQYLMTGKEQALNNLEVKWRNKFLGSQDNFAGFWFNNQYPLRNWKVTKSSFELRFNLFVFAYK